MAQYASHNNPDLFIWNKKDKMCNIVEFNCPADNKITKKEQEKLLTYIPVVQNLQIMYPDYQYQITPIIVAALGSIPKSLNGYVCIDTVKIC